MADSTEKATFDFTPDQLIRAEKELRKASADLIEESMVCPDVIYVDLALLKDIWIGAVNVILSDRKATPEDFHKAHRGILDRVIPYMKRYRHDIGKYFPHLGVTTKDVETILADPARHDEIFIASPVTQFVNTLRANLDINANHANVSERFTKRNMGDGRYTREFQIQSKVVEIYNYFSNFLSGKRGFIQGNYASRRIALGTRNVIAAATFNAATPDDPQMLKVDETRVGLFQTLKAFQPCVVYGFRTLFINHVFGEEGTAVNIPLINPKTISLEYVEVSDEVRKMYTTSDGIGGWINRFRNTDVRFKPITIKGENGKYYYLCMVYDTGDSIYYFRTMTDLKNFLPGGNVDKSKIRPITWAEAFYTAVYLQTRDCHVFVTRYPVIEDTSCYPSRIHISTTSTARIVSSPFIVGIAVPTHEKLRDIVVEDYFS